MGRIKILSEEVTNRIAAGEVIERPFSVVKELVENSIDAQSTKIIVNIVNGGRDLIQIIDNGVGMSEEDAQLAFERHATSKIRNVDDIIHINSLGFRGEAIPSIASVSHFTLLTKTTQDSTATEIIYDSGKLISINQCSANTGTIITVKKIFMNIPVRRKFLKTETVEFKHILNYLHYQSVLYPNISFILTHNGRERFNYPAVESIDHRLLDIFGTSFEKINFLRLDNSWNSIRMKAYIELIENSEKTIDDIHYLFVNGRYIHDKIVFSALKSALEPFLKKYNHFQAGKLPSYIIFLEVEAEQVDVNVHPAKLEIRFRDTNLVYNFIRNSINEAINNYENEKYQVVKQKVTTLSNEAPLTGFEKQFLRQNIDSFNAPQNEAEPSVLSQINHKNFNTASNSRIQTMPETPNLIPNSKTNIEPNNNNDNYFQQYKAPEKQNIPLEMYSTIFDNLDEYTNVWQVNNLYLFLQDKDGLFIIDQHAAHERIIYEQMINRMHGEKAVRQKLLFPVVIDIPNYLADFIFDLVSENLKVFEDVGFNIKTFSNNSLVIDEIPCELDNWDGGDIFIDLLKQLQEEYSKVEDFRDSLAKSMACKAAIKSGKKLKKNEIISLITDLFKCQEPYYCPHGRPLIIKIPYFELEKRFKRI